MVLNLITLHLSDYFSEQSCTLFQTISSMWNYLFIIFVFYLSVFGIFKLYFVFFNLNCLVMTFFNLRVSNFVNYDLWSLDSYPQLWIQDSRKLHLLPVIFDVSTFRRMRRHHLQMQFGHLSGLLMARHLQMQFGHLSGLLMARHLKADFWRPRLSGWEESTWKGQTNMF